MNGNQAPRFYGKYRGKVENNIDPLFQGRVQVSCPAVLGDGTLSWAMPCTPYGGPGVGLFAIPPNGANAWVEFEGGDPDYPIWAGCFWGALEAPVTPALPQTKVFKTDFITLTLNDLPGVGGFKLDVMPPAVATPLSMSFDASGISISNASVSSIKLTPASAEMSVPPASVSVSPGAVNIQLPPSLFSVASAAIAASNGAGSVDITPASVSLNKGALEAL